MGFHRMLGTYLFEHDVDVLDHKGRALLIVHFEVTLMRCNFVSGLKSINQAP